jgi:hypothetical protein
LFIEGFFSFYLDKKGEIKILDISESNSGTNKPKDNEKEIPVNDFKNS